eukprot:1160168-Pelagomonas_calceolata.AAC.5
MGAACGCCRRWAPLARGRPAQQSQVEGADCAVLLQRWTPAHVRGTPPVAANAHLPRTLSAGSAPTSAAAAHAAAAAGAGAAAAAPGWLLQK